MSMDKLERIVESNVRRVARAKLEILVVIPPHLRTLAGVTGDVTLEVDEIDGEVTRRSILDALETQYPMLRGTIREHVSGERRPFLRFFACGEDVTHQPADAPLPQAEIGRAPSELQSLRHLVCRLLLE